MMDEKLQQKLVKLAFKALDSYSSRVAMINDFYIFGIKKHVCMIIELLLLGRDLESIRKTLLFSEENYERLISDTITTLKTHKKLKKQFQKLKGT